MRRGVPSTNARWGNSVAVLTGDFLFSRASHLLADLGPEAVRVQAEAFERLVTGQIMETVGPRGGHDPLDHYMEVVAGKSSSLVAVSGRFGGMMSGADDSVVRTLSTFGERIGAAFQLADDILDIASDSHESGKTPGTDLREGISTLPVLHVRRWYQQSGGSASAEDRRLVELLDSDLTDDVRHAEALELMRRHPAMDLARRDTLDLARQARALLEPLPDNPAKYALAGLCDAVVHRTG